MPPDAPGPPASGQPTAAGPTGRDPQRPASCRPAGGRSPAAARRRGPRRPRTLPPPRLTSGLTTPATSGLSQRCGAYRTSLNQPQPAARWSTKSAAGQCGEDCLSNSRANARHGCRRLAWPSGARSSTDRASDYGSEGWGFESLRARHRHRRSGSCSHSWDEALDALRGPVVSQFLTALSDLVNPGERGTALPQVVIARVDVGPLGESRVIVTGPLADDRDRDARVLTGNRQYSGDVEWCWPGTSPRRRP